MNVLLFHGLFLHGYGRYDNIRDGPSLFFGNKTEEVKAAATLLEKECEGDNGVNGRRSLEMKKLIRF